MALVGSVGGGIISPSHAHAVSAIPALLLLAGPDALGANATTLLVLWLSLFAAGEGAEDL